MLKVFLSSIVVLLVSACNSVPVAGSGSVWSVNALSAALTDSDRPAEDKARDADRKPELVLTEMGITKGMTVVDMISASGWYTEVLAVAVGEEGKVYAQNPLMVLKMRGGKNDKAISRRMMDGRLPKVARADGDLDSGIIPEGSVDAVITALNLHDLYNRDPESAVSMLKMAGDLLKPGGVLGVIDHVGKAGADNASLHRMTKADAIACAEAAGFTVAKDSNVLRNATDNHTAKATSDEIRGKTDRFLLVLKK